jgi:hypothetical protein
LHPLLSEKKLVGGLEEIEFRLREERNGKKQDKPEKISQFFW